MKTLIERLKNGGDEVFSTREKRQVADIIEQLTSALAAKDDALEYVARLIGIEGSLPDWLFVDEAIAIKPHASLVAKIKANAFREAADSDQWVFSDNARRMMRCYADKIESGEV